MTPRTLIPIPAHPHTLPQRPQMARTPPTPSQRRIRVPIPVPTTGAIIKSKPSRPRNIRQPHHLPRNRIHNDARMRRNTRRARPARLPRPRRSHRPILHWNDCGWWRWRSWGPKRIRRRRARWTLPHITHKTRIRAHTISITAARTRTRRSRTRNHWHHTRPSHRRNRRRYLIMVHPPQSAFLRDQRRRMVQGMRIGE